MCGSFFPGMQKTSSLKHKRLANLKALLRNATINGENKKFVRWEIEDNIQINPRVIFNRSFTSLLTRMMLSNLRLQWPKSLQVVRRGSRE
jgi:hypothetical protein